MTLLLNIIGAGKLGKTLGFLLQKHPQIEVLGIVNQNIDSAVSACKFIGAGKPYPSIKELPPADITMIAAPDKEIKFIASNLAVSNCLKSKSIVFHCSGALKSSILENLDVYPLSLHPIKSFASPNISILEFTNTLCTYEGHEHAAHILIPILSEIGARCLPITSENKSLYHASCVVACNYLVTLADIAQNCFVESGLSNETAFESVLQLMTDTLTNLKNTKTTHLSLTGPIQRGDIDTISKHLDAIKNFETSKIYKMLGNATLKLTQHEDEVIDKIKMILNRNFKDE